MSNFTQASPSSPMGNFSPSPSPSFSFSSFPQAALLSECHACVSPALSCPVPLHLHDSSSLPSPPPLQGQICFLSSSLRFLGGSSVLSLSGPGQAKGKHQQQVSKVMQKETPIKNIKIAHTIIPVSWSHHQYRPIATKCHCTTGTVCVLPATHTTCLLLLLCYSLLGARQWGVSFLRGRASSPQREGGGLSQASPLSFPEEERDFPSSPASSSLLQPRSQPPQAGRFAHSTRVTHGIIP